MPNGARSPAIQRGEMPGGLVRRLPQLRSR